MMHYSIVVTCDGKPYLVVDKKSASIVGFKTEQEARDWFEGDAKRKLEMGLTWSTSVVIAWLQFHPIVVKIENLEEFAKETDLNLEIMNLSGLNLWLQGCHLRNDNWQNHVIEDNIELIRPEWMKDSL